MPPAASQKTPRAIAIALLFLVAVNALAAGYGYMADPSGKGVGTPMEYLRYSPFRSFLIPGIVLFLANGVGCLVAAVAAFGRWKHYPSLVFLQGLLLTGWIVVQVAMVRDFNWMHAACLLIGIVLMAIGRRLRLLVKMPVSVNP